MDCAVCSIRSSIGFCVECHILLCEECATICTRCGKLMCTDHVHETRSGKTLCMECVEERRARRKERAEEPVEDKEAEEEEEVGDEALVISARRVTPPWELSMYAVGGAVILGLLLLIFRGLRVSVAPWGPYLVALLALFALIWAVVGLVGKEYDEDRQRSALGLGLGIVLIGLSGAVAWYEAVQRAEERERERIGTRDYEKTDDGRAEWRMEMLDKHDF